MKLLTPVISHFHNVMHSSDNIKLNFCTIDFGDTPFMLGQKIAELKFNDVVYRGVVPLRWNENQPTVAECAVQIMEYV